MTSQIALLIDGVIAFTVIECIALALYHRATGRGVAPREYFANMLSGLSLMLALRGLAVDAGVLWLAVCLLAAGLAHGFDIVKRWQSGAGAMRHERQVVR